MEPKSTLARRIRRQPRHAADHSAAVHTPLAAAPMGTYHPAPPQEMTMPLTLVQVTASGVQVSEAVPLYAGPRGAPIPATAAGRWVQLYAAGRP